MDPASLVAHVDLSRARFSYKGGILTVFPGALKRGSHRLKLVAADYQETKNMENTGPVLPNTRTFRATIVVR